MCQFSHYFQVCILPGIASVGSNKDLAVRTPYACSLLFALFTPFMCRGNIPGERPYLNGTACADCPDDFSACVLDLCTSKYKHPWQLLTWLSFYLHYVRW